MIKQFAITVAAIVTALALVGCGLVAWSSYKKWQTMIEVRAQLPPEKWESMKDLSRYYRSKSDLPVQARIDHRRYEMLLRVAYPDWDKPAER